MMKRFAKVIGVAALAVLALTGCVEISMNLKVNSDETLNMTMEYKYNKEKVPAEMLEGFREEMAGQMNDIENSVGETARVEQIDDAKYLGFRATGSGKYTDPEFLGNFTEGGTSASITKENGVITVEFPMGDTAESNDLAGGGVEMMKSMIDKFEISVSFDGNVLDATGNGAISGNTVTWNTDAVLEAMAAGTTLTVRANETGGGLIPGLPGGEGPAGISWLWWIIGGIVLLAIIVLVIVLITRSGKNKGAGAQQSQQFQQYPPQQGYPQGQPQTYPPQPQQGQPYPPQANPVQQPYPPQQGQQPYPPQPGQTGQVPPAPPAPPA